MSRKQVIRLVAAAILLLGGLWSAASSAQGSTANSAGVELTAHSAQAGDGSSAVRLVPQADTPSPTLGSTPQENPMPGGDQDGDAADFSQVPWVFLAIPGFVAIVAVVLGVYLVRRRNRAPR